MIYEGIFFYLVVDYKEIITIYYNYWKIKYPCSSILNVSSCLSRNRKILFKGQEGCLGDMWGIDYAGFLISCDLQLLLDHASAG